MKTRKITETATVNKDAQTIFLQAEHFHNASLLLGRFSVIHGRDLGVTQAVCSAFALELYLKSLIMINSGEPLVTHNLRKLFDKLHDEHKEAIKRYFKSKEPEMAKLFTASNQDAGYEMMPPNPDFDQQLDASADSFEILRYLHDKPRKTYSHPIGYFAYPIEDGAREAIIGIHPDWVNVRLIPSL
jgi:hypothetical protein